MKTERVTVVELKSFINTAKGLMDDDTKTAVVDAVSRNPEIGELIEGTGGCRKWRFARPGGGKSGGFRIVHYFYNNSKPVYLLAAFAKNQKANLTKAERNRLKALADTLAKT